MEKFKVLLLAVLLGFSLISYADDVILPPDTTPPVTHLNLAADVDVPSSCNATDTDRVVHDYPQGVSYLAICALETVITNGSISSVELSNQYPSMGLFITKINDVAADPNSQYWAILQNGSPAQLGITSLPVVAGDSIILQLHDFSDTDLGDQVILNIHSLIPAVSNDGGGGGGGNPPPALSVPNAVNYLNGVQNPDGSFGGADLYTDWASIALASANGNTANILQYMSSHDTVSANLTDNERHAMALLTLNQNPYTFGGSDFITPIVKSFDGTQFGDSSMDNDDIFALIPLESAGYTGNDDIIAKDIAFIISKQNSDGSWDASVDLTAAAIQALKPLDSVAGVSDALAKAGTYLANTQGGDGGWGNVSSTSWVMQAQSALGASWGKGGKTGNDYLASAQASDGAVAPANETLQNRIWMTSYAIPASLGKPWTSIMHSVSKPAPVVVASGGGGNGGGAIINNNVSTQTIPDTQDKKDDIVPVKTEVPVVASPEIIPAAKSMPVVPEEKKLVQKKIIQKVSHPISPVFIPAAEAAGDQPVLAATAEKSGTQVPIAVTITVAALAGGFVLLRSVKFSR